MTRGDRNGGAGLRPIPPGFLLSYGVAVVGIPFLAIGLGATADAHRGLSPEQAVDGVGFVAFAFMWVMVFGVRLMFWNRLAAPTQALVRVVVALVLAAELCAGVAAVWITPWRDAALPGIAAWFSALGIACQIGTVAWLVRYRDA